MICAQCQTDFQPRTRGRPPKYCGPRCKDKSRSKTEKRKASRNAGGRRHYQRNRDKVLEKNRKWFAANPEKQKAYLQSYVKRNLEAIREKARDYIKRNRDIVLERKRQYRTENPEKQAQWGKDHPEKVREYCRHSNHRRRALKKNSGGTYTREEWEALLDFYGRKCLKCGNTEATLTVDHVVPVSLGGRNDIGNLQPLCGSCNSRKHKKIIDYRQVPWPG